jgi:hypothetical protein
MARDEAAERGQDNAPALRRDLVAVVRDQASPALAARIEPDSTQASPVVAALTAQYAQILGRPDDPVLSNGPCRLYSAKCHVDGVGDMKSNK